MPLRLSALEQGMPLLFHQHSYSSRVSTIPSQIVFPDGSLTIGTKPSPLQSSVLASDSSVFENVRQSENEDSSVVVYASRNPPVAAVVMRRVAWQLLLIASLEAILMIFNIFGPSSTILHFSNILKSASTNRKIAAATVTGSHTLGGLSLVFNDPNWAYLYNILTNLVFILYFILSFNGFVDILVLILILLRKERICKFTFLLMPQCFSVSAS
eukprot:GHVL01023308.1.p1 GENE.GHVL01023308.1~~GHVL01023308.1.p1  ORF type:complete len:213 (+),score=27.98 GHVL01023308.1:74-712(+)